eukprot:944457-Prymnesium_polylepis.1
MEPMRRLLVERELALDVRHHDEDDGKDDPRQRGLHAHPVDHRHEDVGQQDGQHPPKLLGFAHRGGVEQVEGEHVGSLRPVTAARAL